MPTKISIDSNELATAIAKALESFSPTKAAIAKPDGTPYMGTPTSDHLTKINSYLNKETSADDWYVVLVRASDNLVHRSHEKWSMKILEGMRDRSNGISFLLDHDWWSINSSVGFIFDGYLSEEMSPSNQAVGHEEDNAKIIEKEGYHCYFAWVAIPKSQEIVQAIEERRSQFVSTGGYLRKTRMLCPICTEEHGREVGVFDMNDEGKYICPHTLPGWGWWDDSEEMPYIVFDADYEPIEISLVTAGDLPAAEVIR